MGTRDGRITMFAEKKVEEKSFMKREIDWKEISDGKLYGLNDMVKADCGDCEGCWACCQGMGQSVILDPLPNLIMGGKEERCGFLDHEGRCGIHSFRPGVCRLFPLGRIYGDHGFQYFLQVNECRKENRTKVKVYKWLDTPEVKRYEKYVSDWHFFLKRLEGKLEENRDQAYANKVSMYVLKQFYLTPYDGEQDFYDQFGKRLEASSFL